MPEVDELIRRLEVLERDGSAAALTRLEKRVSAIQDKQEGHNTALGKIIMLLEETRLRVSAVEFTLTDYASRMARIETEIAALRRDMPAIVSEALREWKPKN